MMRINFEEIIEDQEEKQEGQNADEFYDAAKARKVVGGLFAEDSPKRKPSKVAIDVLPADIPEEKARTPKSRYVFTDEGLVGNLDDKYTIFEHSEKNRREELRETKRPTNKKSSAPPKRKSSGNSYAVSMDEISNGDDSESGLSSAIRGIAIVLALIFLLMLVFLVYRNNMLSRQLETANLQAERIPVLEQDLSQVRIDLEIAVEELAYAESRLEVMTPIPPPAYPAYNGTATADEYPTYVTEEATYETTETPEPTGERTHTVVSGDNLSRIARQFYGNDSYANIQRIRNANNLTNDTIRAGQVLIIPN